MKNTVKTRTNNTRTNNRTREITPAIDPIAELQAQISTLTQAVSALLANAGAVTPAPAQAKSPARVGKTAKKADPNAAAKKQAHRERVEKFAQARDSWASKTWADCLKLATAEIRKNKQAGTINANIAGDSNRVWLTSTTNQALMAARKTHAVAYAEMELALAKAAK